jgi:hypothetical protein
VDTILSVDLGTTAVKTCLVDARGSLLATATREYRLETPFPEAVEVDPEVYWHAFRDGVAELLDRTAVDPREIRALGVSAQGETLICADAAGRPIRPAIVWLDNRAHEEAGLLTAEFGDEAAYRITGQVSFVPTWPAAKLLWLRRHEPGTFARSERFLLIEDWFIARLTGRFVCEGSLVTSTMYWDLTTRGWWPRCCAISVSTRPGCPRSGSRASPSARWCRRSPASWAWIRRRSSAPVRSTRPPGRSASATSGKGCSPRTPEPRWRSARPSRPRSSTRRARCRATTTACRAATWPTRSPAAAWCCAGTGMPSAS